MKKNLVQQVMVHMPEQMDTSVLSGRLCNFYFEIVQCQLNASDLTPREKIAVVNQLLDYLRKTESNGVLA